jgi:hypothetical protein
MNEKEILSLGFKVNQWVHDGEEFVEYILGNGKVGIEISGLTLVEITYGKGVFITVPNCKSIDDLKDLIRLFGIKS